MLNLVGLDLIPGPKHKTFEYYSNCPHCVDRIGKIDTNHKMGINVKTGVYHCFRCKAKGKIKDSKEFDELNDRVNTSEEFNNIRNRVNGVFQVVRKKREIYDLNKISDPLTQEDTPIAWKYLTDRGVTEEEIKTNNIRVGTSFYDDEWKRDNFKWSGRILFPFFNSEGEVTFIVARSINGKEPKYLNSKGGKSHAVYGLEKVKGTKCILCEGIISAIAAERVTGISAVCLLGKTALPNQLLRLREKVSRIFLSLDGGEKTNELQKQLFKFGFKVYKVTLPKDSDPDDLGANYLQFFQKAEKVQVI